MLRLTATGVPFILKCFSHKEKGIRALCGKQGKVTKRKIKSILILPPTDDSTDSILLLSQEPFGDNDS